jgi:iron complex outermembrane recepter protein
VQVIGFNAKGSGMSFSKNAFLVGLGAVGFAALGAPAALAQTPTPAGPAVDAAEAQPADEIVVTGTRVANRTRLDTIAPVDVISADALSKVGSTEVNQALSIALPSFNFPRPTLSDGSDNVRPATLRSLAPDQSLVLVNSKRRHASSLVNVNSTIGRGSAAVDLNTIPTGAIGSIEVLRDGASAQYGSDAIAGVINVRLREADSGGSIGLTIGQRFTEFETINPNPPGGATWQNNLPTKRKAEDGFTYTVSGWTGLKLFDDGFLTISGEYKNQDETIRAGVDPRQQYPLVGGLFDPRENTIGRVNAWYGDPRMDQYTIFANFGVPLDGGAEFYGWGSYQTRDTISAGFFRRAIQERAPGAPSTTTSGNTFPVAASQNIIAVYPNGFLPKINAVSDDLSLAAGVRFDVGGWAGDASLVFGRNELSFGVIDTLNVTLGPNANKASFDAGSLVYDQTVLNVSFVQGFEVGLASPLNVAVGFEARREGYQINAGEPDSYRDGGWRYNTATQTWGVPPSLAPLTAGWSPAVPGAQVFPGFRPTNEVDEDRTAVGLFIDLEANVTDKLLISGAVRAENYSDFGSSVTGKFAARYDFTDGFAIRGAASTGFRAPSLQQSFFTSNATNFVGGVPLQILTTPATSSLAKSLGAQPLDAETSTNYSAGFVLRADNGFSLTADAFSITIEDRIVLSENLGASATAPDPAIRTFVNTNFPGTDAARFFLNGVDTETTGFELVASWRFESDIGTFDTTLSGSHTNTKVTKTPRATGALSTFVPAPTLFGRVARLTLEDGQPKEKISFQTVWDGGPLGLTVRSTFYGSAIEPGGAADGSQDIRLGEKALFDLEGRWDVTDNFRLNLGAENIFDEYPDATPANVNASGNLSFSRYSPFGFNGRYVYLRAGYTW